MIGPVCEGCGTAHPDLHLPPNNAKEKTLAMDDRDITELTATLNDLALAADNPDDPFSRGVAAGLRIAVEALSRYVAPAAA